MKRDSFIPFTLKLRDLKKDVDPKTWKLIEPHVEEIIELVMLNDAEYNKETWNHFSARLADGDFDNESILRRVLAGTSLREVMLRENEAQAPNYLIQFVDQATDKSDKVKVYAKDMESARKIAYSLPQAKSHKYSDVWISELKSGAQVFGVTFNYVDRNGRKGRQILFIKAKDEDQAKAYYNKHFKGNTFWQSKPEKIDPDGGCVYSDVYDIDYTTIIPDDFTGPDATVK